MKFFHKLTLSALSAILLNLSAGFGAIVIPGADGSDGVLNITSNTVIDLSQAITGNWDASNTNNAGKGIYDSNKWAVVFKYSNVAVAAGVGVAFKNHPSRAPVVWLVNGNVRIAENARIDLSGNYGDSDPNHTVFSEPGPGGFRGGDAGLSSGDGLRSAGFGPGGSYGYYWSQGGQWQIASHGSVGYASGSFINVPTYGNSRLIPLIGGSGTGGENDNPKNGGGAGGGAILIASTGEFRLDGWIRSAEGYNQGGSGGAVRIVTSLLVGSGKINVKDTVSTWPGAGRIRVEALTNSSDVTFQPGGAFPVPPDDPVRIWPDATWPTARITHVGNLPAPADPRAGMGPGEAVDLNLPAGSRTNIVTIETSNLPTNATVSLRINARYGGPGVAPAKFVSAGSDPNVLIWQATTVLSPGYFTLQVIAR